MSQSIETFSFAPGFRAAAAACGLKTSSVMGASSLDVALVAAEHACSAAAVFTRSQVKAAPVLYDQQVLATSAASIRAVILNAGNANACTGAQGMANTRRQAELTAYALRCQPDEVFVLSTGVIGRQLDMDKVTHGIAVVTSPAAEHGAAHVARAMMTTDTHPKTATQHVEIGGATLTISGCCKGAGMIHPNMATMLAIITTDVSAPPEVLQAALNEAVARSFNRISVDGDTSTNDTVLLLASGVAGILLSATEDTEDTEYQQQGAKNREPRTENQEPASRIPPRASRLAHLASAVPFDVFTAALTAVCTDLAKQVARDGEGATRLIEIVVGGARDEAEAHLVANSIACSPLVKTAVHGGDPNWGRVFMAAGKSGATFDQTRLSLALGGAGTGLTAVVADGLPLEYDERAVAASLRADPVYIQLDLGQGDGRATVWTCDFSKEYVEINAHYTT